ncbi:MAG TPA: thioredoxin fold domain-containing protein [Vicinamibacteria bacterium]|nr:thioredoxin fold domain-containing protein [Vicinamibacteria bacterium]
MWDERANVAAAALVATLAGAPASAGSGVDWGTVTAESFRTARETGRPVLVYFTGSPCGRRAPIGDPSEVHETDCEKFETRTASHPAFVEAAARFVPLVVDTSPGHPRGQAQEDLFRRFKVATLPTLLVADPWGNEILRLVGPTPAENAVRVLRAMPEDLRPLREVGEALAADPSGLPALLAAASFYERAGLRPVAGRYYETAASTSVAKADPAARRSVVVARRTNLLVMGRAKDAAVLFSDEAGRGLDAPQSDVVLFGWAMAALTAGDRAKAVEVQSQLARLFPDSAYTRKLAVNLAR